MGGAALYAWEIALALALLGFGLTILRWLQPRPVSLALAGILGVSFLILLGGPLSLLHLIRRDVIFALTAFGVVLFGYQLWAGKTEPIGLRWSQLGLGWKLSLIAGAAITALLLLGYLRPLVWNGDDLQAYIPYAKKALQGHALQPDPFSERRINTAVGGQIFLDAFLYATKDFHALPFADSVFGYVLYVLLLAEILRTWSIPRRVMGVLLLLVPVFSLIKVNLTLVYLSVAAFLAVLLLLTRAAQEPEQRFDWKLVLPLAILLAACFTTKSSNIVFAGPLVVLFGVADWWLHRRSRVLVNGIAALALAVVLAVPWSVVHHRTEGTYLFPTLGLGYHASAYGRVLSPSQAGSAVMAAVIALPVLLLVGGALLFAFWFTRSWKSSSRISLLALLASAWVAVLAAAISVGGESVDRYTAPFAVPALLLFGAGLTNPQAKRARAAWVGGAALFAMALLYEAGFVDWKMKWFREDYIVACQAFGRVPGHMREWEYVVDSAAVEKEEARAAAVQASLPAGATVFEATSVAFPYDFRRNTVYIADFPGMAGLAPGMPLGEGAPALRQYLLSHGIEYAVYDRRLDDPHPKWPDFLATPALRLSAKWTLRNAKRAHEMQPWGRMEWYIASEMRRELLAAALAGHVTYDDGTLIAARLD